MMLVGFRACPQLPVPQTNMLWWDVMHALNVPIEAYILVMVSFASIGIPIRVGLLTLDMPSNPH